MANELNYTQYDYNTLLAQLEDRIKQNNAWDTTWESGTGQMIIELYAYVANMLLYYVERTAEELYIETAQRRSSVVNLVALIGYSPRRVVSSTGVATISIPAPLSVKVFIPSGTVLTSMAGYKYLVSTDSVILAGVTSIDVPIKQGVAISTDFYSNGTVDQTYNIADNKIENTSVSVTVNDIPWTVVDTFINSNSGSKVYKEVDKLDDTTDIIFGNNVFGESPESGQKITVSYIQSGGLAGNVYQSGKITAISSQLFDETSTIVNGATVTNSDTVIGGEDAESIEEIKYNAPRVFATGERAVTKSDFISILEDYPGVANANVWGENEENPPNYDMFNRVKLSILLQEWQLPNTAFKATLSDFLYTKSLITIKYEYVIPDIIEVIPTVEIYVVVGSSLGNTQAAVETTLSNLFLLGTTTRIGTNKRYSDIVRLVDSTAGVDYHYLTLKLYQVLTAGYTLGFDYGTTIMSTSIQTNTIEIYDDVIKIGKDDGLGGIVVTAGGYTLSGSVNYTTGLININVTGLIGTPSVRYQQNNKNDLVVGKNQILKYKTTDVTSIQYS
jgi:hypothetical protein